MNPELVVTDYHLFVLVLSCIGSVVVGFLAGFLIAHWSLDKALEDIEKLLEEK